MWDIKRRQRNPTIHVAHPLEFLHLTGVARIRLRLARLELQSRLAAGRMKVLLQAFLTGGIIVRSVAVWLGALGFVSCLILGIAVAQTPSQNQYQYPFQNPNLSIEERVTNIDRKSVV